MPGYAFRRGGEDNVMPPGGATKGGASVLDVVDDPRDLVGSPYLNALRSASTGEGRGDISRRAFNCGEDMMEPGESDPADECRAARMLCARRGRLDADVLWRRKMSESRDPEEKECCTVVKSVLIWRPSESPSKTAWSAASGAHADAV
jgi:hypothetical protein